MLHFCLWVVHVLLRLYKKLFELQKKYFGEYVYSIYSLDYNKHKINHSL